jgi:hypothetical protein
MLINRLIKLLNIALSSSGETRLKAIKKFQDTVWDDITINDENINGVLTDIAYILDFYEPNEEWRKESPNYFGDENLENLIKSGIGKIKALM